MPLSVTPLPLCYDPTLKLYVAQLGWCMIV